MFLKDSPMESVNFFKKEERAQGTLCKNVSLAGLLRGQYLFKILQILLTIKVKVK